MKLLVFKASGILVLAIAASLASPDVVWAAPQHEHGASSPCVWESAKIARRVKAFYAYYMAHINDDNATPSRAKIASYSSRRLVRWMNSKEFKEYNADYFLQAQDYDADWGQVRIGNTRIQRNTAFVSATLGNSKPRNTGIGERKLRLKMNKENGVWKIDRVDAVDD